MDQIISFKHFKIRYRQWQKTKKWFLFKNIYKINLKKKLHMFM